MKLRDHAKGKWPQIITAIVGEQYADTRKHQPCPKGDGTDRYRFSDVDGTGRFFCACSDGDKDGFDLLQCCQGVDFKGAAKLVESVIGACEDDDWQPEKPHWIHSAVKQATSVPRSRYLEARGLKPVPELLFHRDLPYYVDDNHLWSYPAMIAPIRKGDAIKAYHVTYLDGARKAEVPTQRKILGGNGIKGGAIRLAQHGAVLGVAEGIETALSATALHNIPVWSVLNTSLMGELDIPEGVTTLVIFADHDENYAGHAAAYKLAHRAKCQGVTTVHVRIPEHPGDWNDVLMSQKERAA